MSAYASLLSRLRDAEATATRFERALAAAPRDRALQLDSASARRLARKSEGDFRDSAVEYGIDVCTYRLIPTVGEVFTLESVTKSLSNFQHIFSLIYADLAEGPRRTARIPGYLELRSTLEFGYTFAGSLGVVLTLEEGKTLFDDRFDTTVDALNNSVDLRNSGDVRQITQSLGPAVVKKLYEWSKTNQEANYSLDLQWQNSHGLKRGRFIEKSDFVRVTDLIGLTNDVTTRHTEVNGILAGGDIITRRFHFVDDSDKDYKGLLQENFQAAEPKLGGRYKAFIQVDTTWRYSSEEEDERYTLRELRSVSDS